MTVDLVIFSMREGRLCVLLVERKYPPYRGKWALPGGFVREDESLGDAAVRELAEETGVSDVFLEQLYTFGDLDRDPRGRVVTVAYLALLAGDLAGQAIEAGTDASDARWTPVDERPPLAFDHDAILSYALERLRNKFEYTTASFSLLPEKFTLGELQAVFEAVLGKTLDKRNFRKKIDLLGILQPLSEWRTEGPGRPAQLQRFSAKHFSKLKDLGILFPF